MFQSVDLLQVAYNATELSCMPAEDGPRTGYLPL